MTGTNRFLLAASALVVLAGCASTQQMDELRAMAEEAKETAQRAEQKAEQAQRDAAAANQCCADTNEKIDRMFKRSMYK